MKAARMTIRFNDTSFTWKPIYVWKFYPHFSWLWFCINWETWTVPSSKTVDLPGYAKHVINQAEYD